MPFATILDSFNQSAPRFPDSDNRAVFGAVQDTMIIVNGSAGKAALLVGINYGQTGSAGSPPVAGRAAVSAKAPSYAYDKKITKLCSRYPVRLPKHLIFWIQIVARQQWIKSLHREVHKCAHTLDRAPLEVPSIAKSGAVNVCLDTQLRAVALVSRDEVRIVPIGTERAEQVIVLK